MEQDMEFLRDALRHRRNALEDRKQQLSEEDEELSGLESMLQIIERQEQQLEKMRQLLEKTQEERDAYREEITSLKMQQKELGQMSQKLVNKAEHDDLLKVWRGYMNVSKRKTVKKRGYIKMVISEMAVSAGMVLPEDMQRELENFDDDEIQDQQSGSTTAKESELTPLEHDLMPIFFNDRGEVARFVKKVNGASNPAIAEIINGYITGGKILMSERKKPLWTILSRYKVYSAGYDNFKAMVN